MKCQTRKVRTLDLISFHVQLLLPYIGALPLRQVCNEGLEQFKLERQEEGRKNSTINRSLEVVRSTLIRATRVWREDGEPWLTVPPLIEMLDERAQKREPYPITWAKQSKLLQRLPGYLQRMVEFAVNTGARGENVCGLRWSWEAPVPELKRGVFVVPPEFFKVNRKHVLILNDAASSIVEARRGEHDKRYATALCVGYRRGTGGSGQEREPHAGPDDPVAGRQRLIGRCSSEVAQKSRRKKNSLATQIAKLLI